MSRAHQCPVHSASNITCSPYTCSEICQSSHTLWAQRKALLMLYVNRMAGNTLHCPIPYQTSITQHKCKIKLLRIQYGFPSCVILPVPDTEATPNFLPFPKQAPHSPPFLCWALYSSSCNILHLFFTITMCQNKWDKKLDMSWMNSPVW